MWVMIQDIATSIGRFDVTDAEYHFMQEFIGQAQYDDYDLLVQLCNALVLPAGFCLLEKRFFDVALPEAVQNSFCAAAEME